jgi:hypothetical protein
LRTWARWAAAGAATPGPAASTWARSLWSATAGAARPSTGPPSACR